jgi:tetratricopeptide (TPR) repeat protein
MKSHSHSASENSEQNQDDRERTHLEPARDDHPSNDLLAWIGRPLSRRALCTTAVVIFLTILAVTAALNARHASREHQATWRNLQVANANALLAAQQLDSLFAETLKSIPLDGNLRQADNALLEKWLQADEQFLADNEGVSETRFEQGIAHRRTGQCRDLQGKHEHAALHYRQAIELFDALSRDHPTVPSYVGEQVDIYIRLGWAKRKSGNLAESDAAFRKAAELIGDRRVVDDPSYAPHVSYHPLVVEAYLLDNQVARAAQAGAQDQLVSSLERIVAIFRELNEKYPEHCRYLGSLAEAEARLAAARDGVGQP